jgi:hypothetical protein
VRYGYISIEGWAALTCWAAALVLLASTGGRLPSDGVATAIGICGLAALVLTARWSRNRFWLARTRLRSEAWYEGRAVGRRRFREQSKRKGRPLATAATGGNRATVPAGVLLCGVCCRAAATVRCIEHGVLLCQTCWHTHHERQHGAEIASGR